MPALRTRLIARETPDGVKTKQQIADYKAALRTAIANYIQRMKNWITQNTTPRTPGKIPKATGYLAQSSTPVIGRSNVSGTWFEAHFGFDAKYASYVDRGSPPHYPPIEEIRTWCKTVGLPVDAAEAIAWKIYQHGTKGYHFFDDGVIAAKQILKEELGKAFRYYNLQVNIRL